MANINMTAPPLPNPFTPLAFLPPARAAELEALIYLSVATLSAFIWDGLMSISEEIKVCRQRKFSSAMAVYLLARIGTLVNCTMSVIFLAAPVPNCKAVGMALNCSIILAGPFTTILFFFRVKAVYHGNKIITCFFGVSVLALVGLSFLAPLSFSGGHLGKTQRCTSTHVAAYISVVAILQAVIDTLVFVAISLRIITYSLSGDTFGARMRSFMRGDGLPHLSKSLLQGGQMYYFTTIGLNIAVIVLIISPLPKAYHAMLIRPHVALNNSMASRVFRRVRLGLITDNDGGTGASATNMTTLRWASTPSSRTNNYSWPDAEKNDH